MDTTIVLASAPDIVNGTKNAIIAFLKTFADQSKLMLALQITGGLVVVACIAILLIGKFWPASNIASWLGASKTNIVWVIIAGVLGACLALPQQVIPFVSMIVLTPVQWVLNIIASIMGW